MVAVVMVVVLPLRLWRASWFRLVERLAFRQAWSCAQHGVRGLVDVFDTKCVGRGYWEAAQLTRPLKKETCEVMSASSSAAAARRGREDEAEDDGAPSVVPETPVVKRSRRGAAQEEEERKVDEAEESARAFPDGVPSMFKSQRALKLAVARWELLDERRAMLENKSRAMRSRILTAALRTVLEVNFKGDKLAMSQVNRAYAYDAFRHMFDGTVLNIRRGEFEAAWADFMSSPDSGRTCNVCVRALSSSEGRYCECAYEVCSACLSSWLRDHAGCPHCRRPLALIGWRPLVEEIGSQTTLGAGSGDSGDDDDDDVDPEIVDILGASPEDLGDGGAAAAAADARRPIRPTVDLTRLPGVSPAPTRRLDDDLSPTLL